MDIHQILFTEETLYPPPLSGYYFNTEIFLKNLKKRITKFFDHPFKIRPLSHEKIFEKHKVDVCTKTTLKEVVTFWRNRVFTKKDEILEIFGSTALFILSAEEILKAYEYEKIFLSPLQISHIKKIFSRKPNDFDLRHTFPHLVNPPRFFYSTHTQYIQNHALIYEKAYPRIDFTEFISKEAKKQSHFISPCMQLAENNLRTKKWTTPKNSPSNYTILGLSNRKKEKSVDLDYLIGSKFPEHGFCTIETITIIATQCFDEQSAFGLPQNENKTISKNFIKALNHLIAQEIELLPYKKEHSKSSWGDSPWSRLNYYYTCGCRSLSQIQQEKDFFSYTTKEEFLKALAYTIEDHFAKIEKVPLIYLFNVFFTLLRLESQQAGFLRSSIGLTLPQTLLFLSKYKTPHSPLLSEALKYTLSEGLPIELLLNTLSFIAFAYANSDAEHVSLIQFGKQSHVCKWKLVEEGLKEFYLLTPLPNPDALHEILEKHPSYLEVILKLFLLPQKIEWRSSAIYKKEEMRSLYLPFLFNQLIAAVNNKKLQTTAQWLFIVLYHLEAPWQLSALFSQWKLPLYSQPISNDTICSTQTAKAFDQWLFLMLQENILDERNTKITLTRFLKTNIEDKRKQQLLLSIQKWDLSYFASAIIPIIPLNPAFVSLIAPLIHKQAFLWLFQLITCSKNHPKSVVEHFLKKCKVYIKQLPYLNVASVLEKIIMQYKKDHLICKKATQFLMHLSAQQAVLGMEIDQTEAINNIKKIIPPSLHPFARYHFFAYFLFYIADRGASLDEKELNAIDILIQKAIKLSNKLYQDIKFTLLAAIVKYTLYSPRKKTLQHLYAYIDQKKGTPIFSSSLLNKITIAKALIHTYMHRVRRKEAFFLTSKWMPPLQPSLLVHEFLLFSENEIIEGSNKSLTPPPIQYPIHILLKTNTLKKIFKEFSSSTTTDTLFFKTECLGFLLRDHTIDSVEETLSCLLPLLNNLLQEFLTFCRKSKKQENAFDFFLQLEKQAYLVELLRFMLNLLKTQKFNENTLTQFYTYLSKITLINLQHAYCFAVKDDIRENKLIHTSSPFTSNFLTFKYLSSYAYLMHNYREISSDNAFVEDRFFKCLIREIQFFKYDYHESDLKIFVHSYKDIIQRAIENPKQCSNPNLFKKIADTRNTLLEVCRKLPEKERSVIKYVPPYLIDHAIRIKIIPEKEVFNWVHTNNDVPRLSAEFFPLGQSYMEGKKSFMEILPSMWKIAFTSSNKRKMSLKDLTPLWHYFKK